MNKSNEFESYTYSKFTSSIFFSKVFFVIIFLCPLFPEVMGSSQIHINFLAIIFSSFVILIFKGNFNVNNIKVMALYYFLLQLLLAPSFLKDILNGGELSGFFSFFRPMLLFVMYLSFKPLSLDYLKGNYFVLVLLAFLSVCYGLLEILRLDLFSDIMHFFYKREDKIAIEKAVVTFFGTTYYSGYAFFTMGLLCLGAYEHFKKKILLFTVLICVVLVILAQSKLMWFSLLISMSIYFYFKFDKAIGKLFYFFIFTFFAVFFVIYLETIVELLSVLQLSSIRSLSTLVTDTSNSGTLLVRLSQIIMSFNDLLESEFLFGLGLGRDQELESWLALFLFRYGIYGPVVFILLVAYLSFSCISHIVRLKGTSYYFYPIICFIWVVTLPLTQLSSAMIETSKLAYLSAFLFSITTNLNRVGK